MRPRLCIRLLSLRRRLHVHVRRGRGSNCKLAETPRLCYSRVRRPMTVGQPHLSGPELRCVPVMAWSFEQRTSRLARISLDTPSASTPGCSQWPHIPSTEPTPKKAAQRNPSELCYSRLRAPHRDSVDDDTFIARGKNGGSLCIIKVVDATKMYANPCCCTTETEEGACLVWSRAKTAGAPDNAAMAR